MQGQTLRIGTVLDIFLIVKAEVSHTRNDETIEAKALWFQSLTLAERMDLFCEFTDLALEINPHLPDSKDAQPTQRRIRVLSAA
jgi:hypothetical protein